jgi:DNA/RNA endonuclease G (NUC1)
MDWAIIFWAIFSQTYQQIDTSIILFFPQTPANRKLSRFRQDPNLPPEVAAKNEDFWDSGWSRGHMVPAGNNKFSQEAMNDTFYLSNIVPQVKF